MKNVLLSFSTAILLLLSSCSRNAVTPSSNINFQLNAAVSPVNGAAITWTAGTAGIANAKIETKKNDSTQVEFKSSPNTQVDLFGAVSITNVPMPSGTYHGVEFRSELKALSGKPALYLNGTYTAGGVTTPISFEVGTDITIIAERDSIVLNATNGNYTALTTLGLITLTQDVTEVDLKAAIRTSGKIIISANSNIFVYNKMLANLAKPQVCQFK